MSYLNWFIKTSQKHKILLNSLQKKGYSKSKIIDFFDFDNLKNIEPKFCTLFIKDKKCHNMNSLNCYMCACDNFRFKLNSKNISYCKLGLGERFEKDKKIYQNCLKCKLPHQKRYILKRFNFDWSRIFIKTYRNSY